MCSRYKFEDVASDGKLVAIVEMMGKYYPGEYKIGEIFPGDTAPAVIERDGKITAVPAVFGFPGFQEGKLLINARSETAAEKRTFSEILKTQRIILPATGFYEWGRDTNRTKYQFKVDSRHVMYLCGLYQIIEGQVRFVILTRAANESMIETHERMPVIAAEQEVRPYLTDYAAAKSIITLSAPKLTRERV